MSRRRKHVRDLVDEPCPALGACEFVCRVVELRGGNHIEVEKPDSSRTLCRIPSKFSKILWVRAGSFIVARFEDEKLDDKSDVKVTGEMTRALYNSQMKEMRKAGRWPERFLEEVSGGGGGDDVNEDEIENTLGGLSISGGNDGGDGDGENINSDYSSDSSLPPIEVIRNRPTRQRDDTESDESDDD